MDPTSTRACGTGGVKLIQSAKQKTNALWMIRRTNGGKNNKPNQQSNSKLLLSPPDVRFAPRHRRLCRSLAPAWQSQTFLYNLKEKPFCWCELSGTKPRKGTAANKSELITGDNKAALLTGVKQSLLRAGKCGGSEETGQDPGERAAAFCGVFVTVIFVPNPAWFVPAERRPGGGTRGSVSAAGAPGCRCPRAGCRIPAPAGAPLLQHKLGGLIISIEVNYVSRYSKSPVHAILSTSFNSLPPVNFSRFLHRIAHLYHICPFQQRSPTSTASLPFVSVPRGVRGRQGRSRSRSPGLQGSANMD